MTLLSSCWFLIEDVLISDGNEKWFCLSFFIHPQIFILCQVFSWIGVLGGRMLAVLVFPFRIIVFVSSQVSNFLTNHRIVLLSINHGSEVKESIKEESVVHVDGHMSENESLLCLQISVSRLTGEEVGNEREGSDINMEKDADMDESFSCTSSSESLVAEEAQNEREGSDIYMEKDADMDESFSCTSSSESLVAEEAQNERELGVNMYEDMEMKKFSSCVWSSKSHDMEQETKKEIENNQLDPFFGKYIERMKWFDQLNYERTCEISAILNKQLGTPSSFESIKPTDFSVPFLSWSKMDRRKLLRSLENDFEMVYVGQSCLCWEALHHQYRKVEALACSSSQKGAFYNNLAGEFQNFQILLERFMENEVIQGKRFWNYVQGRFSLKNLLQVPEVSGYSKGGEEAKEGEAMGAREVLETIEKSIMTFSIFVSTDTKKSWWRFRSSLWSHQPVEDPKDLELLFDLKNLLQKELYLRGLQQKKKCWLKRAEVVEHNQRKEIFFSMIDMKLVSRVLQMSIISSPQLKWCQEKLNSIDFKEGKVIRAWTNCYFPSS